MASEPRLLRKASTADRRPSGAAVAPARSAPSRIETTVPAHFSANVAMGLPASAAPPMAARPAKAARVRKSQESSIALGEVLFNKSRIFPTSPAFSLSPAFFLSPAFLISKFFFIAPARHKNAMSLDVTRASPSL